MEKFKGILFSPIMKEADIYEVEGILDSRMYRKKKQYLIKWLGYSHDDNTWENEENLFCDILIKEFEEKNKAKLNKQLPKKTFKRNNGKAKKEMEENDKDDNYLKENCEASKFSKSKNAFLKTKNEATYKLDKVIIDKTSGKFIYSKNREINNGFDGIIKKVVGIRRVNNEEFIVRAQFRDRSTNIFSLKNAYHLFPLHLLKYYEKHFLLREPEESSTESEADNSSCSSQTNEE